MQWMPSLHKEKTGVYRVYNFFRYFITLIRLERVIEESVCINKAPFIRIV